MELHFEHSCRLEQGRLLQVLAGGYRGGVIVETGTGCAVGLSWMLSTTDSDTRLCSVEKNKTRARACQRLFRDRPNVRIDNDDWTALIDQGPFDLLVLDGGRSGKIDLPIVMGEALVVGGTLVVADFTPFSVWPPSHEVERDDARLHWLEHPDLLATEIRLSSDLSTIVATRIN